MKRYNLLLALVIGAAHLGYCADTNFLPQEGDWDVAGNWDNGLPTSADDAIVQELNGYKKVFIKEGMELSAKLLKMGAASGRYTGYCDMSGGLLTIGEHLQLAYGSGGNTRAFFTFSGGTLNVPNGRIGGRGVGVFTQEGGTLTSADHWLIGHYANGVGTNLHTGGTAIFPKTLSLGYDPRTLGVYRLSNDGIINFSTESSTFNIGRNGDGIFEQDGGMVVGNGTINLGHMTNGNGRFTLNSGTFEAKTLEVGKAGSGYMEQYGGSLEVAGALKVGSENTSTGTLILAGGEIYSASAIYGASGKATVEQYGGTNSNSGWMHIAHEYSDSAHYRLEAGLLETGWLVIGNGSQTSDAPRVSMELNGGRAKINNELSVGRYGSGSLVQRGGTLDCGTTNAYIGMRASGVGVYTQYNGTASFQQLRVSDTAGAWGQYICYGGGLQAGQLIIGNQPGSDGTLTVVGTNAGIEVSGRLTLGQGGTYEVTFTADGFSAPVCDDLFLSTYAKLKVNASEPLPRSLHKQEITVARYEKRENVKQFNTVTLETGAEQGAISNATLKYYEDRMTITLEINHPPLGTLLTLE